MPREPTQWLARLQVRSGLPAAGAPVAPGVGDVAPQAPSRVANIKTAKLDFNRTLLNSRHMFARDLYAVWSWQLAGRPVSSGKLAHEEEQKAVLVAPLNSIRVNTAFNIRIGPVVTTRSNPFHHGTR